MGTITVLRLEDANGGGCFDVANMQDYTDAAVRAGLMTPEEDAWEHFHTSDRGCPGPSNDWELNQAADAAEIDLWDGHHFYAFPSLEVAREWFPPCMAEALERNGQTLTVWEVPEEHVAASSRQAVFCRDLATLVERLPVSALYEEPEPLKLAA